MTRIQPCAVSRIGRSSLDDAREALAEYLALLSPSPESEPSPTATEREGATKGGEGEAPAFSGQEQGHGTVGAVPVDLEKSLKAVMKLYGRAVGVLRDKQERELLTEALCDMGDLHVSKQKEEGGGGGCCIQQHLTCPYLINLEGLGYFLVTFYTFAEFV